MEHSEGEHGRTGPGIMDYGDGKLNGIYQFNTRYRKQEMCRQMNSVAWLTRISTPIWRFPIHVPQIHPNFNRIFHKKNHLAGVTPWLWNPHEPPISSGYCHFNSRHDSDSSTWGHLRTWTAVVESVSTNSWCLVLDLAFGPLGFVVTVVVHHI